MRQTNFIASHSNMWLPGSSLKKIAILEMRHTRDRTQPGLREPEVEEMEPENGYEVTTYYQANNEIVATITNIYSVGEKLIAGCIY